MEKYIYKITNLINNKIYIGQAKDVSQRWYEHCLESATKKNNRKLCNAIRKYGVNNFKVETIEGPIENYNEREQYWIAYYNTFLDAEKGYNMTIGGEDPPVTKGEKSYFAKYKDEDILKIQKILKETALDYAQISQDFGVTVDYLSLINRGLIRRNDELEYPLRKHDNCRKDKKIVYQITYLLLYTTNSIEEIGRKLEVDSNTIYKINKGAHFFCNEDIEYPIRNPHCRLSNYLLNNIYNDILDNKLKLSDIEKKYGLSKSTINRINTGKTYYKENFSYPLRPSNERVYNSEPVTTIPGETGSRATIDTQ